MWWWPVVAGAVPLDHLSTGHLVVDVEVAGRPRRFLLDTGASVVTLSPALAAALGVPAGSGREARVHTANGSMPVRVVPLDGVAIAAVDLTGARGAVLDLAPLLGALDPTVSAEFASVEGVLGRDFFLRADVTLDFDAAQLRLSPPGAAAIDGDRCVALRIGGGLATARGQVGGRPARLLLDLGANAGQVSTRLAEAGTPTGTTGSATGAEGLSVGVREVQFADVSLGALHLGPQTLNTCTDAVRGVACPNGRRAVLGLDALGEQGVVTWSYARRSLCVADG